MSSGNLDFYLIFQKFVYGEIAEFRLEAIDPTEAEDIVHFDALGFVSRPSPAVIMSASEDHGLFIFRSAISRADSGSIFEDCVFQHDLYYTNANGSRQAKTGKTFRLPLWQGACTARRPNPIRARDLRE